MNKRRPVEAKAQKARRTLKGTYADAKREQFVFLPTWGSILGLCVDSGRPTVCVSWMQQAALEGRSLLPRGLVHAISCRYRRIPS
jgi:hypothetical protein